MINYIHRNRVCDILFKDNNGLYRLLFSIEGDKPNDHSFYIVRNNHINPEVSQTEEEWRNFALQRSIHSRLDNSGMVDVHMKRGDKIFAREKRNPIDQMNYISMYNLGDNDIEKYPHKVPNQEDILIKSKPDFIKDYEFVFYNKKNVISNYLRKQSCIILHKYNIPLQYNVLYFALAMKEKRLIEIQSKKNYD